jgi:hypothetical protein
MITAFVRDRIAVGLSGLIVTTALFLTPAEADPDDVAITLSRGPGGETLELTLAELAELPQVTVVTENEFSNGLVAYRGPLARDVLEQLALMQFETLRFTAANDYYIEIPVTDFRDYEVILAMQADGVPLARRDKGPLWLMYPISDHEELTDPIYIHRLIWQVEKVEPS